MPNAVPSKFLAEMFNYVKVFLLTHNTIIIILQKLTRWIYNVFKLPYPSARTSSKPQSLPDISSLYVSPQKSVNLTSFTQIKQNIINYHKKK